MTLDRLLERIVELHKKHSQMVIDLNDPRGLQTLRMHLADAHDLGLGKGVALVKEMQSNLGE